MTIRIHCAPINITVIAAYAPAKPSTKAMPIILDEFFDLQLVYKNTRAQVRINSEFSDSLHIENGVMQGGIFSPALFNILFDFIIGRIVDETALKGVKFAFGSNKFHHGAREKYDKFAIPSFTYADDLIAMCNTIGDFKIFTRIF
jgi:hypothetical protein